MKRIGMRFIALLLIAILLIPAGLTFAGGYNLAGVGAKALAMSCAYRGIADDWSAMYWNPAGLAGQSNALYVDIKSLTPIVWLTPNVSSHYPGYEGYRNGVEQTAKAKNYFAGSLGYTYQHNDKYTFGFSVYAPAA